jgi:REP element-mobilizing transposase RayT
MPQSLAQFYLHLVFSTKHRQPLLSVEADRIATHEFLATVCRTLDCPSLKVGGIEDHVHILCRFDRSISVSDLVKELKRVSSLELKTRNPELRNFYWQNGYGAFSASPEHVEALIEYIANQEQHHREEAYADEYRRLLNAHGLQWDERYVWDCDSSSLFDPG